MKIITTVGISLFTNYMKPEIEKLFRNEKSSKRDNHDPIDIEGLQEYLSSEFNDLKEEVEEIKKIIKNKWLINIHKVKRNKLSIWEKQEGVDNKDASSEIKSICKICEELPANIKKQKLEIYLVTPDTFLAKLAAEIIKEELQEIIKEQDIIVKEVYSIKGWQVNEVKKFINEGLNNFYKYIREIIESGNGKHEKENFKGNVNVYDNNSNIILNVSGGYKSILPYMTTISQIYNIPIKYIYEESDQILTFDNMPFAFNPIFEELYYPYLDGNNHLKNPEVKEKLKKYGLVKNDGSKTELGNIFTDYIYYNYKNSKNVLGYYMEYKFYEYYIENIESISGKKMESIKRSDRSTFKKEIDLLIKFNDSRLVVECKSINFLNNKNYKHLKSQIMEQINKFDQSANETPKEYHLCLYRFKVINNLRYSDDILKNKNILCGSYNDKLKQIKKELFKNTGIIFKVYLASLEYSLKGEVKDKSDYENYYQKFMTNPLTDVVEIKIEEEE